MYTYPKWLRIAQYTLFGLNLVLAIIFMLESDPKFFRHLAFTALFGAFTWENISEGREQKRLKSLMRGEDGKV